MTKHDRVAGGRVRTASLVGACLSLLALPGCSDVRMLLGMDRVGPDEFAVESRAPLLIPPDFNLRPPQPGATRPNEVTAAERARRVIDSAGPGEPGKQATFALAGIVGWAFARARLAARPEPAGAGQQHGEPAARFRRQRGGRDGRSRETTPLKGVY